ncbi:FAD-dependent oxidoreductase [Vibrio sp. NTOU-M3]|uniref:FAD-dependent oxidoreductase n=1 Tax=Vibrio sp. NTOU-M3 TaxID=3234954 RepID=UPI00349F771F
MDNHPSIQSDIQVAVIGGGVAGATTALHLAELGVSVTLIEKKDSLVSGPPICHLHAGGNLYREISLQQCQELLQQSIDTVRLYPHTLNRRPTVIVVPKTDKGQPEDLLPRLESIRSSYKELVKKDPSNQLLGQPDDYYKLYSREDLEVLSTCEQPASPTSADDWVIPFAKNTDLSTLKFPVVVVQEFGWSVFRLAATATLALENIENAELCLNSTLKELFFNGHQWLLAYEDANGQRHDLTADYVVNACGFETGRVDDLVRKPRQRLVEFKAAYVTKWDSNLSLWPEVIFHGPRGTDEGMGQLTPYADGVFQLHGMTNNITLFNDGLAKSGDHSAQPVLPQKFLKKIATGWDVKDIESRTGNSIQHMSQWIPEFSNAKAFGKPLFGAQQIPGEDETLRSADVSFEEEHYARLEVVKGSSALEAASKIASTWGFEPKIGRTIEETHPVTMALTYQAIENKAVELAKTRQYPEALALNYGE